MGKIRFTFQREKALEVILYMAKRANPPDRHNLTKILYLADKMSLERHGRFICGDSYVAMKDGPVPSATYDILKERGNLLPFRVEGYTIIPKRDADTDELSESDIECLNEAIKIVKPGFTARHDQTADAAYKKAWKQHGIMGSVPMDTEDIVDLLGNSKELKHYLTHRG